MRRKFAHLSRVVEKSRSSKTVPEALLIRGSRVRVPDGSPRTTRTSETPHRRGRGLALKLALKPWWTRRAAAEEAHRRARPQPRAGDPARGDCSALSW